MELKKTPKADLQNKKSIFFQIGLCLSLLITIGAFAVSQPEVSIQELENNTVYVEEQIVEITQEEAQQPQPQRQVVQIMSDIINIVRDDKKIESNFNFTDFDQDVSFDFQPAGGGGGHEEAVDEDTPFMNVEEMPKFRGGTVNEFRTWVQERLKYPVIAQENGISGRVTLTFVIERDGSLTNIQVLASPDRSLSEEAIRVVTSSPKWTPGKQRGMAVRVRYNLPLEFRLN